MEENLVADTELSLIHLAQDGDRGAYGELVQRHYKGVVNVIYRMCGDTGLAEDMAQEAFLRAWVKLPSYIPSSTLRNWLYRIAVNATLDVLRRHTEAPIENEMIEMIADENPNPEAAVIAMEQSALLQEALRSLPEAARSVLVLREYGDLAYQEIAEVLDIPVGTVMSRLNYARNRLRELVKAQVVQMEYDYA